MSRQQRSLLAGVALYKHRAKLRTLLRWRWTAARRSHCYAALRGQLVKLSFGQLSCSYTLWRSGVSAAVRFYLDALMIIVRLELMLSVWEGMAAGASETRGHDILCSKGEKCVA